MSGGVWNGFLLELVREEIVPCRFCGAADSDGHLFAPLWSNFVKILNFMIWYRGTKVIGLGVYFGMDGCLLWLTLVVTPPAQRLLRISP